MILNCRYASQMFINLIHKLVGSYTENGHRVHCHAIIAQSGNYSIDVNIQYFAIQSPEQDYGLKCFTVYIKLLVW